MTASGRRKEEIRREQNFGESSVFPCLCVCVILFGLPKNIDKINHSNESFTIRRGDAVGIYIDISLSMAWFGIHCWGFISNEIILMRFHVICK